MGFFGKAKARFFRKNSSTVNSLPKSFNEYDNCVASRDNSSAFLVPLPSATADDVILVKKKTANTAQLEDLAEENIPKNEAMAAALCQHYSYVCAENESGLTTSKAPHALAARSIFKKRSSVEASEDNATNTDDANIITTIRKSLPEDAMLSTPFGMRRLTYADYTASGRSLRFVEDYIKRVVGPLYANTHTETSATGLQTTHFREEARSIILKVSVAMVLMMVE